jgi:hypothetical protein
MKFNKYKEVVNFTIVLQMSWRYIGVQVLA